MNALYYKDWDASFIPHILKEIYMDRVYDRFFVGRSNLTVVDLGANIGLFSRYALPYTEGGRLIAVEPDPEHVEALNMNLSGEDMVLPGHIEIVQKAIANKSESKTFYRNPQNTTSNTLLGGDPKHGFEVECWTMDQLFEECKVEKVDFLKLDIEGSEFEVLGGSGFVEASKKINTIVGEIHNWAGRNYNQVKDSLQTRGFTVEFIRTEASIFVAQKL